MLIRYYRGRWPDEEVPDDMPTWSLFEVDIEMDNVLRDVQIFDDGSVTRNSLDIEARHGPRHESLHDCSFVEVLDTAPLAEISAEEFELHWGRGRDTSFWNPAQDDQNPSRS